MLHRILVALDDSDGSYFLFRTALELAQKLDAHLLLLHVMARETLDVALPLAYPYSPTLSQEVLSRYKEQRQALYNRGRNHLRALESEATAAGVVAEFRQEVGDAAEMICTVAQEYQADAIMIGRRGHSGLDELLLGSVSNHVLHHAPCSVFVVQGNAGDYNSVTLKVNQTEKSASPQSSQTASPL